jgi:hypothetical protein
MNALPGSLFLRLLAAFALLAFAGDIVADSMADLRGDHCVSQTSQSDSHQEKTPCSHSSCAIHNGSVIAANNAVLVSNDFQGFTLVVAGAVSAPFTLPGAIDHPPQLA